MKPMDFIPLAERSGYIVPIGEWVLKDACRQLADWREKGLEVRLAVNVSARQFNDPALVETVLGALREYRLESNLIELELTESTAMVDVNQTIETVRKLKEHGIDIIIDDFGSGFSSMAWLKHLNARAIKIDRFFIQNVAHDANDAAIVKAIVSMAHSMGMEVIAEGIETEEQLAAIRAMRWERSQELACDYAQGFLFSEPVPAEKAAELLATRRP
jgi:EAL domain-containing protein (putative c-di-GMP-specific phosphodiesterase class I)